VPSGRSHNRPSGHPRTDKGCHQPSSDQASVQSRAVISPLKSAQVSVVLQQGDHVAEASGVDGGGVKLVSELDKSASSLALSSASRKFSLLSCCIRFSRSISFCCSA
jgi:hypothetical protein